MIFGVEVDRIVLLAGALRRILVELNLLVTNDVGPIKPLTLAL